MKAAFYKIAGISKKPWIVYIIISLTFFLFLASHHLKEKLVTSYLDQYPVEIRDRNEIPINRYPNEKGHYVKHQTDIPGRFKELLIKKEDRFFYYHPGINPVSTIRAAWRYISGGNPGGSSTITQQLVKILLGNEQKRTLKNKFSELIYTLSLELYLSKDEILKMYTDSVYLGNQAQGFKEASYVYFGKPLEELNDSQILNLLSTIPSPSTQNPWKSKNSKITALLADKLNVEKIPNEPAKKTHRYQSPSSFELQSMGIRCKKTCLTTIDNRLTEKLRKILKRNINYSYARGVRNGAIVVIKVPENELLAIVGSPDPTITSDGSQINMAIQPRPIGSTVKPFIYLEGFRKGLRPYTNVEDREYKYSIATGFPIYPKNYDGKYRGTVTLHQALSNSLNVPSVKVLEYVGLPNFYDFLEKKLKFIPIQSLENYQLGIALGELEMDLLTLTHLYSIFTNDGILSPLTILKGNQGDSIKTKIPPQSDILKSQKVAESPHIQLINRILSDRKTGVDQFGIKSNLNLTQDNYAVKTGTSRDFHDSWVIGYTPDFILGVWIGNSENTPLLQVTGQSGAGRIWHESMELMFTTAYNKRTPFAFNEIADFEIGSSIEYGLPTDNYKNHISLLKNNDLILSPHPGDIFEFVENTSIPLEASADVKWLINKNYLDEGKSARFRPSRPGEYEIKAIGEDGNKESFKIIILKDKTILP